MNKPLTSRARRLKMEKLILRLNSIAQQRKALLDRLWVLESETEKLRIELVDLVKGQA
jgi:hypothetical protein